MKCYKAHAEMAEHTECTDGDITTESLRLVLMGREEITSNCLACDKARNPCFSAAPLSASRNPVSLLLINRSASAMMRSISSFTGRNVVNESNDQAAAPGA